MRVCALHNVRRMWLVLGTLEKSIRILELFKASAHTWTVRSIAVELGLPRSTVYRYVTTMKKYRLLEEERGTSALHLGHAILDLAQFVAGTSLREVALPFMERLNRRTGEAVILATLRGSNGVCIEKVESHHAFRVSHNHGAEFPLYAGATGKVLLANLDLDEQDEIIESVELSALTATTIDNKDVLREELKRIRRERVAESHGEAIAGVYAVSSPVFGRNRRIVAALTVSAPEQRLDGKTKQLLENEVRDAAEGISGNLSRRLVAEQ